jgi:myo-inositol-1(or 4)-monophosphatase
MSERREPPRRGELLDVAIDAVHAAGAVLRTGLGRSQVELKNERTSIVTWADTEAQAAIISIINDRFPDHSILGEEGSREVAAADFTWLVDPLDGTSNFAHGVPFACTSVGVRDAEGLAAGAIFEPFRGELFTAIRGGGAWLGTERLRASETGVLDRALVCTGVQADDPTAVATFAKRVEQIGVHCRGVRCLGSPALCLAYIAAGRIDAFLERDSTYAWDLAAGALMITEAGGRIEDLDGGPINLGPGIANVLATNGRIHEPLATLMRAAVR